MILAAIVTPSYSILMFVSIVSVFSHIRWSHSVCRCLLMSCIISASILGTVFGNQDQFHGLAIFLDTFRNDLHGMDVSVQSVGPVD